MSHRVSDFPGFKSGVKDEYQLEITSSSGTVDQETFSSFGGPEDVDDTQEDEYYPPPNHFRNENYFPIQRTVIRREPKETRPSRQKYSRVSDEARIEFIRLVSCQFFTLKEASQYLGINYSTGKSIYDRYRKTGQTTCRVKSRTPSLKPSKTIVPREETDLDIDTTQENPDEGEQESSRVFCPCCAQRFFLSIDWNKRWFYFTPEL